jgi:hypothetical protein
MHRTDWFRGEALDLCPRDAQLKSRLAILTGFRGFCPTLYENTGIVPRLGHDNLLRNPFNLLVILPSKAMYSLGIENVVKQQK